ncbi:MAG: hypothetical protein IAG10_34695 [Planctomycetaceae bacterium]|nr:hypothetical protein [Planctomycetaceae bacterium]
MDRYQQPNGQWITIVFTGDLEQQNGAFYLINPNGRQTPVFQGMNYIDDGSQVVDLNGDHVPEIVVAITLGEHDDGNPNKVVTDATSLDILPISSEQVPLLRIIFDVRPFNAMPSWRWRLAETSKGIRDVVLDQQTGRDWIERARFAWSSKESKFEGSNGSKGEGFIASPADLGREQIRRFMQRTRPE